MAKILAHVCFNPFAQRSPPESCRCSSKQGLWISPIEAAQRMKLGLAVRIGRTEISVCGRLPTFPRGGTVDQAVIEGNAMGNRVDQEFLEEIHRGSIRQQTVLVETHTFGGREVEVRTQVGVDIAETTLPPERSVLYMPRPLADILHDHRKSQRAAKES